MGQHTNRKYKLVDQLLSGLVDLHIKDGEQFRMSTLNKRMSDSEKQTLNLFYRLTLPKLQDGSTQKNGWTLFHFERGRTALSRLVRNGLLNDHISTYQRSNGWFGRATVVLKKFSKVS